MQLAEPDNYTAWAGDFRQALFMKDEDGFIDGVIPFLIEERLQWQW